jgi:hypothetical protein
MAAFTPEQRISGMKGFRALLPKNGGCYSRNGAGYPLGLWVRVTISTDVFELFRLPP